MTIFNKIKDIVGEDMVANCAASDDFINSAVMEVADMIPADLLLRYHSGTTTTINTSAGNLTTVVAAGKRIISIVRRQGAGGVYRDCLQVNEIDYRSKYIDSNSSYKATALTPVWTTLLDKINIFPSPNDDNPAEVYAFTYPTTAWGSSSDTYFTGMPTEVEQAILFRAAMNIVQSYISNSVQEDEDAELQQMLTGQLQTLSTAYQAELARFMKGGQ